MHYYKRNLGDYAKKAGHLSPLDHGVYNLIIDAYYDRERAPKLEDAMIWARAKTKAEKKSVEAVLNQFFDKNNDGSFSQKRIEEEIAAYRAKSAANSQIAKKRESTKRAQVVHETCSEREHDVVFREPNHKPLTNNHKPLTNIYNTRADEIHNFYQSLVSDWESNLTVKDFSIGSLFAGPKAVMGLIDSHSLDDCRKAIKNYAEVLASPDHFYNHKVTLQKFLEKTIYSFFDIMTPLENFKIDKNVSVEKLNQAAGEEWLRSRGVMGAK
ncbi:MAG: DUF1376 domain-containing protein [Gammaproteobacteria bacterium]|nr:DUF1376 domain-containing protein [Gammaproteobacteria bacterium]